MTGNKLIVFVLCVFFLPFFCQGNKKWGFVVEQCRLRKDTRSGAVRAAASSVQDFNEQKKKVRKTLRFGLEVWWEFTGCFLGGSHETGVPINWTGTRLLCDNGSNYELPGDSSQIGCKTWIPVPSPRHLTPSLPPQAPPFFLCQPSKVEPNGCGGGAI